MLVMSHSAHCYNSVMIWLLNKLCAIVNIPDDIADEYNTVCLARRYRLIKLIKIFNPEINRVP